MYHIRDNHKHLKLNLENLTNFLAQSCKGQGVNTSSLCIKLPRL